MVQKLFILKHESDLNPKPEVGMKAVCPLS